MLYSTKKLLEVGEIITGYTPSKNNKEFWGGNTLFVKPPQLGKGNIVNKTEETLSDLGRKKGKLIKKNSIMVCCIGSLGKIGIAGQDLCTNQQINSIYFNEKIVDFKYGYYYCTTLEREMNLMANQAIISIINKTSFSKIQIPLPPLPTQKLIVQKLDLSFEKIDKSIELTKMNLENIEELNKSVFIYKIKNLIKEYESDIISNYCQITSSKRIYESDYVNTGVPFYRIKDIVLMSKNEKLFETKFIKNEVFRNFDGKFGSPKSGDILLTAVGATLGYAYQVKDNDGEFYFKDGNLLWLKNIVNINGEYLTYLFKSDLFKEYLNKISKGAAQPAITIVKLKDFKIPVPPLQKQKEIVTQLDKVFEKNKTLKQSYEKKLKDLEEMKQSLLREAFEGRLVKE